MKRFNLILFLFFFNSIVFAQLMPYTNTSTSSMENFRVGVLAFFKGQYNDALFSFEKALNFKADDPFILEWLGNAYYKTGLESTALKNWQLAVQYGRKSAALEAKIELIKTKNSVIDSNEALKRVIISGDFLGKQNTGEYFLRPASIVAERDGSYWATAYGSNDIVHIDVNGIILQHIKAGLRGLDRPYGIAISKEGQIFVSESNADRISTFDKKGNLLKTFGVKGLGDDQLLGPQNIVFDENNYLYIVDYGNRRIVKYYSDGKFILNFGKKNENFDGLLNPTGICTLNNYVFVADSYAKCIFIFDSNGNYIKTIARGSLIKPEGLSISKDSKIIVSDTNRIVVVDPELETIQEIYRISSTKERIISAVSDYAGNIAACDFDDNRILLLSNEASVYAGYSVSIEKLNASNFPKVSITVSVKDNLENPVLGLNKNNFYISELNTKYVKRNENGKAATFIVTNVEPVDEVKIVKNETTDNVLDAVILVENSNFSKEKSLDMRTIAATLINAHENRGQLSIVKAQEIPEQDTNLNSNNLANTINGAKYSDKWRFDLSLRLAAQSLSQKSAKRAIFFISTGILSDAAFSRYSLSELASFLKNNGIQFVILSLDTKAIDPALVFLANETGGSIQYAFKASGLKPIIDSIIQVPKAMYTIEYTSASDAEFGKRYIPLSCEVYLGKRSGRDELGYFAPLK